MLRGGGAGIMTHCKVACTGHRLGPLVDRCPIPDHATPVHVRGDTISTSLLGLCAGPAPKLVPKADIAPGQPRAAGSDQQREDHPISTMCYKVSCKEMRAGELWRWCARFAITVSLPESAPGHCHSKCGWGRGPLGQVRRGGCSLLPFARLAPCSLLFYEAAVTVQKTAM